MLPLVAESVEFLKGYATAFLIAAIALFGIGLGTESKKMAAVGGAASRAPDDHSRSR